MPKLKLKKFDPKTLKDDRICLLVAPRGSGKSTCGNALMYHMRHLPMGIVMSATEDSNHAYRDMVPDSFIYNDFSEEALQRLIERQKRKIEEYAKKGKQYPNAFIIADDCMADKKIWKSKLIRDIFLNGRHRKVFVMMMMQYCMDISVELRSNIDYVFCLMEDNVGNKERLYRQFFGVFPNFESFQQVFDQVTDDYGVLVLDKTIRSNRIEDKVFYWKAPPTPKYKLGCAQYWEYDKLRNRKYAYIPETEEDEDDDLLKQYNENRAANRPKITVVKDTN